MRVLYQYDFKNLPGRVINQIRTSINSDQHLVYGQVRSNFAVYLGQGLLALLCVFFLWIGFIGAFGDPVRDNGWHAPGMIIWYAILMFGLLYALNTIYQRQNLLKKFQFLPGRYIFPYTLLDATSERIAIYDLTQMRNLDVVHHSSNGAYSKTVCTFLFKDGSRQRMTLTNLQDAQSMVHRFNAFQTAARNAFDQRDLKNVLGFDPVADLRRHQWVGARAMPASWLGRAGMSLFDAIRPLMLISSVLLAGVFWYGRNAASDVEMAKQARRLKTEAAYTGYLKNGRFYLAQLRAELPRVAFEEVRQKHSVTALRELKNRYPGSEIVPDASNEIHLLYQKALEKFQSQAVNTDSKLVSTMEQLLRFAEEHDDPQVIIKFTRPTPEALSHLDSFLKSREIKSSGMKIAPASRHFSNDSAGVRETRITQGLSSALGSIFPNDVLAFRVGQGGKKPHPAIEITYQIEPSGSIYFSEKHKEDAFVGLVIRFQASILVPQSEQSWNFNLEVEPPQRFNVEYKTSKDNPDGHMPEGQVYAVMAERAFDHLSSKITAAFFRPDSAVFIRQMQRAR